MSKHYSFPRRFYYRLRKDGLVGVALGAFMLFVFTVLLIAVYHSPALNSPLP